MLNLSEAKRSTGRASTNEVLRACMFTAESHKGHARYTRDLLSAIAEVGPGFGIDIELVTGADLAPAYRSNRYPIHTILPPLLDRSVFRTKLGWGVSRVTHYVRRDGTFLRFLRENPEILVVHLQEYTPWQAARHFSYLRRKGVAVVMTVHNISNHGHASQRYVKAMRTRWRAGWRACSALIVHTEGLRDQLSTFLGPNHPPIHVTPHAVWEERSTPPVPAVAPRAGEPARLLFFGMIRRNKGLHVLLQAMEHLPNCTLTVAGEQESREYRDEILKLAARLPEGRIELIDGYIDEAKIAGLFDRAHLVILPYIGFAGQSGVLHQALAHGRPVVASDLGGLGESVRSWGIGEVVTAKDEHALVEGVRKAMIPDRYAEAAEATEKLRGELTWAKMAEATCDVYRSLLS